MEPQIITDYGANRILEDEFGLSAATITRYLRGQYRPNNKCLDVIKAVRVRAEQLTTGKKVYVARDEDGKLHYFNYEPKKEDGIWLNKLDPYNRKSFPEELLPPSAEPKYTDRYPILVQIKREPNRM